MKITEVEYQNLKNINETMPVSHLNLLTGPNGSGKTGRLLGLSYAITGKTQLGDKLESTMQLSGATGLGVGVRIDDGFGWRRSITKDPKIKSVTERIRLDGQGDTKFSRAKEIVTEHVGSFAPMFDLGRFLSLSPEKRREFILNLCSQAAETIDQDGFLLLLELGILKGQLGIETVSTFSEAAFDQPDPDKLDAEQKAELVERLKKKLPEKYLASLKDAIYLITSTVSSNITDSITNAAESAKEQVKFYKMQRDQSNAAARKLADEKSNLQVVSGSVQSLTAERDDFLNQKEQVIEQIANQCGRESAIRSMQQNLERNGNEIESVRRELKELEQQEMPDEQEAVRLDEEAEKLEALLV